MMLELQDYKSDMMRCARCSLCKWPPLAQIKSWRFSNNCPSISRYNFHAYSGGGKMAIGLALMERRIEEYTDEMIEVIYRCATCGACDSSCKYNSDLEVLQTLYSLRSYLVGNGYFLPEHSLIIDSLRKEDNTLNRPKAERGKWAEGLKVKNIFNERADIAYHAGCMCSYDQGLQEIARASVSLLQSAGVDVGIRANQESCCGLMSFEIGFRGEFTKFAESNIEDFNNAGVSTVVTSCACCYSAFKSFYPLLGKEINFNVMHIAEYLDQLVREKKLEFSNRVPLQVTYHDPCNLGRKSEQYVPWVGKEEKVLGQFILKEPAKMTKRGLNGIYDPPRNVIKAVPGIEFKEMERIREYAWCCGAGGGVKQVFNDFAVWTAAERIAEARATGAQAIVTSCPWCERNLADAIAESNEPIRVYDLVELVGMAL